MTIVKPGFGGGGVSLAGTTGLAVVAGFGAGGFAGGFCVAGGAALGLVVEGGGV